METLVEARRTGDQVAQRQLYDLYHERIYRLAVRMVGLQDAADVLQQVLLQVFRTLGQFDGRSRFDTWLYRLSVNESLQHLRRNKRWNYHALDWEPEAKSADSRQREQAECLEEALRRIAPDLRAIFVLREIEGLSYDQIAAALSVPQGTVGSRLNRARRELQLQLEQLGYKLE